MEYRSMEQIIAYTDDLLARTKRADEGRKTLREPPSRTRGYTEQPHMRHND
jgi:hypothetical protein